jgi:uncharacterized protein (DUF305 family)
MQTDAGALGIPMSAMGMPMDDLGMRLQLDQVASGRPADRAFIDVMIPHHQGAIRMARAEVAHGRDSQLRALAHRVVAAQSREIKQMNRWRASWYGAPSPAGGVPTG